jgi:hypothetical protein
MQNTYLVASMGFDPTRDLLAQENGLWQWSGRNPAFTAWAKSFFSKRREDTSEYHITEDDII